jgi:hypothetical protein
MRIALGKTAQSHAAPAATPKPPIRFPAKKIGKQVSVADEMFNKAAAINEWNV